ncbi:hypothetical protein V8G54_031109 [Vigna mungo]|uniref:UDP-glucuronic acid decarboxylase 1 n=1 Tax=Vigna mungo TaxID=3915 RepID=A0AAQ3RKS6_VIGMU
MKQLHKQPSLNHRREEEMGSSETSPYSPKSIKHTRSLPRSINYLLREQRLLFILVGILIGSTFFIIQPTLSRLGPPESHNFLPRSGLTRLSGPHTGRVPVGITGRRPRIVVTGGAGFVGSHLVDKLIARGDDVIVIDNFFTGRKENLVHLFGNPRFELIRHDVVEPILLEVDQIYHLACPASPTNVMGTLNMLGLAKRIGARFLLTSTSEVYGDPLEHPQKETYWGNVNPIGERSCYDEGKRTAETLAMDYHRGAGVESSSCLLEETIASLHCTNFAQIAANQIVEDGTTISCPILNLGCSCLWVNLLNNYRNSHITYRIAHLSVFFLSPPSVRDITVSDFDVRIARIFNTYGPRMCLDDGRVVSNFVAQAIRKQPLTVYGDGKQTRSFQYVSDLVNGLVALMESEHVGPFNLGNPGEFTMLELAEVVKETIDSSATIEYKPNTADDPHMRKPDISKAKELLNWEPKVPLREGLPLMVNDFRNRILNEDEGKGMK